MKTAPRYDVFLSYRRAGGQETALLLYDRLTARGYSVAYDIETLRSGRFDEQLLRTVDHCRDLVLVLAPGALDRCVEWEAARQSGRDASDRDEDDWMRLEVARALKAGVNVVPVLLRGFSFPRPEALPADIRTLPLLNGVEASTVHFNDTLEHIVSKLRSKPRWRARPWARFALAGAVAAMVAAAVPVCNKLAVAPDRPYPSSRVENQQVDAFLSILERHGSLYGEALSRMLDLAAEASTALLVDDSRSFDVAEHAYSSSLLELYDQAARLRPSPEATSILRDSPLSLSGLDALLSERENDIRKARTLLPARLKSALDKKNPLDPADKSKLIAWISDSIRLEAESYALDLKRLLLPIDPKALAGFHRETANWPSLSGYFEGDWPRDGARMDREAMAIEAKKNEIHRKFAEFTGTMRLDSAESQRKFETVLQDMGATKEAAERISGKAAVVGAMESEVEEAERLVGDKKADVFVKHRARSADTPDALWGKAMRFRAVKFPEGALEALSFLRAKQSPDYPAAAIDSMEALVKLGNSPAPADGGVLVSGFEPPADRHAVFQPGDVIVACDGVPIRRFSDYHAKPGGVCRFFRLDASGTFHPHEAVLPGGQPRMALLETVEAVDE